eukprot:GEMP01024050.1.p1 GENE.GEMP01024050.1~~GEMP01024050.1.p1  ORF type:complete len:484 (+),score=97.43 GEMP01024050.1:67-1518(+)
MSNDIPPAIKKNNIYMYRPGLVNTQGTNPAKSFNMKGVGKGLPSSMGKGVKLAGGKGVKIAGGKGVKIAGGKNAKGNVKPVSSFAAKTGPSPSTAKGLNANVPRGSFVGAGVANPSKGLAKESTQKVALQKIGPMKVPALSATTGAAKGSAKGSSQAPKGLTFGAGILRPIALVKGSAALAAKGSTKGTAAILKPIESTNASSLAQKGTSKEAAIFLKSKGLLKVSPSPAAKGMTKGSAAPAPTGLKKGASALVSPWASKGNPSKTPAPATLPVQGLGRKVVSFPPKGSSKGTGVRISKIAPVKAAFASLGVAARPAVSMICQVNPRATRPVDSRMVIKHNLKNFRQIPATNPPKAAATPLLRMLPVQPQKKPLFPVQSALLKPQSGNPGASTVGSFRPGGVGPVKRVLTFGAGSSATKRLQTTATTFSTADKPTSKSSSPTFPSTTATSSGVQKQYPAQPRVLMGFKRVPSHAVSTAPQKKK